MVYFFFFPTQIKLSLKNKIIPTTEISNKNQIIGYDLKNPKKIKTEINIFSDDNDNIDSSTQLKKISIRVKKGQTFSEILDNYDINNNTKFEVINSISKFFNLKGLKINQKIIFFMNSREIIKKIIIELNFKTNLIVNLDSPISVERKELKTNSSFESIDYIIKNSLYSDGINNKLPNENSFSINSVVQF